MTGCLEFIEVVMEDRPEANARPVNDHGDDRHPARAPLPAALDYRRIVPVFVEIGAAGAVG